MQPCDSAPATAPREQWRPGLHSTFSLPAATGAQTLALPQDSIFNSWTANSSLF